MTAVLAGRGLPRDLYPMMSFEFRTVPDIRFGVGAADALAQIAAAREAKRVLIVTDEGVRGAGLVGPVEAALREGGAAVSVFADVVADPPETVVLACGEAAKDADLVVGLGGGSPLDTAKLAAVLATGEQKLAEMYGVDQVTASRLPLVLVPTTAGTGSEVTPIAIVTTGETTKSGVVSPILYADTAILDPALTRGLPAPVTAATGVDAMVHAIEAYTSKRLKNPISDALAREALRLLSVHVEGAFRDGASDDHRGGAMLGAMLAGQAFANAPVAAVHALAYPLGGPFHLPHGLTNSLVLPHVIRFNLPAAAPLYAELAEDVCGHVEGSEEARADAFVARMEAICEAVGLRRRLREFEISHNHLPGLAEDAMKQTRLLVNNPREVAYDDALGIYEAAW